MGIPDSACRRPRGPPIPPPTFYRVSSIPADRQPLLSQVLPQEATGDSLPPAYALELLTIFAWEQGCGESAFSLARGLRTVLGLIEQYQHLCIYWTLNYDSKDPTIGEFLEHQLRKPRYL